jgi:hypothetical protein
VITAPTAPRAIPAAATCEPLAPPAPPAPAPEGFAARCKRRLQECFIGYPAEFEAPPLGDSVYRTFRTQITNSEAASMTLYEYDFCPSGAELNERGRDRLAQIQCLLPHNPFPIVIERTPGCPGLAEGRRLAVLTELAHGAFPVPPERVLVGRPQAIGMSGVEAELVYRNLYLRTRNMGAEVIGAGILGGRGGQGGLQTPAATGAGIAPVPQQ